MTRKDGTPRSLPTTLGLDPLPWNNPYEGRRFADNDFGDIYVHLEPRPGYSQNPADYGVYDDPWAGDRDVAKFDAHNRGTEQS